MSEINFSKSSHQQLDPTLIKLFLTTVKDGNLAEIKNNIEKYNFDVKYIKDSQYDQNALFYAALIKDDNEYEYIF
jgi:hypothetical protein